MGQGEVYAFLKDIKRPCTSKEIASALQISSGSVTRALGTMIRAKEVEIHMDVTVRGIRLPRYSIPYEKRMELPV